MDLYFGPSGYRDEKYYRAMISGKHDSLMNLACMLSETHIQDIILRMQFVSSVRSFAKNNVDIFATTRSHQDRIRAMQNIKDEEENLLKQHFMLLQGEAKLYVTATFEKHEKTIGYIIDGIAIVLGGVQVIAGASVIIASVPTGNIIGMIAGASLALSGANSIHEQTQKIKGDNNPVGFVRDTYMETATFLGFDKKTGDMAFQAVDLISSLYAVGGLFLKPEAWRLFHYLPADFQRKVNTMGKGALTLKIIGTGNKIRVMENTYTEKSQN